MNQIVNSSAHLGKLSAKDPANLWLEFSSVFVRMKVKLIMLENKVTVKFT